MAKQFLKFCLVGVFNTAFDFVVYYFLTRALGVYYLFANLISVFLAMTASFFLNKKWTFKNNDKQVKTQYFKFALVNLVYFILNNGLIFIGVNYFGWPDLWVKAAATVIGLFWNFGANKYWTFRV
ncbi:MAG: GtrA family protein [Candidatus Parcubacteria bacterium]|nr:GtrA family protein [Candidatus Parcubacteria bacterium]